LVVPKSDSILPSITRKSLIYVAEHILHIPVEERAVRLEELKSFKECGLCGTAAVISPVGKIQNHEEEICFPSGMEKPGKIMDELYRTLIAIQDGEMEAPEGWIRHIQ
ncbi:MAG: aminotransferase class IV, partial [Oribacterium parvum]|jgi:branched-chain-amino-acid transaminase